MTNPTATTEPTRPTDRDVLEGAAESARVNGQTAFQLAFTLLASREPEQAPQDQATPEQAPGFTS